MFAQVLIAVSFVLASYYDIKERAVYDLVWLPAVAGAAYAVYSAYPDLAFPVLKLALVGGIALAFLLYGGIGQADAIALALIAADPYRVPLVFPLIGAAVVALAHTAYEFAVGNARGVLTIPMEKFLREQRWIPKAVIYNGVRKEVGRDVNTARDEVEANYKPGTSVEVTYGVPTVAYLGIGYIAYLVCLLLFNQAAFFSLP